jgi:hypothetical protein
MNGIRKENFVSRKMLLIGTSSLHSEKETSQNFYPYPTSTSVPADGLAQLRATIATGPSSNGQAAREVKRVLCDLLA